MIPIFERKFCICIADITLQYEHKSNQNGLSSFMKVQRAASIYIQNFHKSFWPFITSLLVINRKFNVILIETFVFLLKILSLLN